MDESVAPLIAIVITLVVLSIFGLGVYVGSNWTNDNWKNHLKSTGHVLVEHSKTKVDSNHLQYWYTLEEIEQNNNKEQK